MKFIFKEVTQNNEKKVAVFRSEDQSCELFITGRNSDDFSHFKPGSHFTIVEAVEPTTAQKEE